jgi:hypothetical protein
MDLRAVTVDLTPLVLKLEETSAPSYSYRDLLI